MTTKNKNKNIRGAGCWQSDQKIPNFVTCVERGRGGPVCIKCLIFHISFMSGKKKVVKVVII